MAYIGSSQPAVSVKLGTALTNVTGDGTVLGPIIFDTVEYEQGSNYNTSTGIFTATAAGFYYIAFQVTFTGLTGANTSGTINISSSLGDKGINNFNPGVSMESGRFTISIFDLLHLNVGETVQANCSISGSTKTVGIDGEDFGQYSYINIFQVI